MRITLQPDLPINKWLKVETSKTRDVNDVLVTRYLVLLSNKMSQLICH